MAVNSIRNLELFLICNAILFNKKHVVQQDHENSKSIQVILFYYHSSRGACG